ncbi:MAG: tetratricopeptide repeat protein [Bifidobacteriaceae bacterium]|nr:tetratricopeptide repeat protein [Bifidobacteriaceae bacterium]
MPVPAPLPQWLLDSNAEVLVELKDAARDQSLVPFVGAGMSKPIFPLWQEVLEKLIKTCLPWDEARKGEVHDMIATFKLEEAASLLEEGSTRLRGAVYDEFSNSRITAARLDSMPVRLLPKLFAGPVVTTNFDRVIEWAYQGRLEPVIPPFGEERPAQTRAVELGEAGYLIKIHGCVSRECEMVFTKEDYDNAYGEDFKGAGALYLRTLLVGHRMLFLGCGLRRDRTLDLASHIAPGRRGQRDHFAVVEAPEEPDSEDFRDWWTRLYDAGIGSYWYPHGAHERVEQILKYLLNGGEPPTDNRPPDHKPPDHESGTSSTRQPVNPAPISDVSAEAPGTTSRNATGVSAQNAPDSDGTDSTIITNSWVASGQTFYIHGDGNRIAIPSAAGDIPSPDPNTEASAAGPELASEPERGALTPNLMPPSSNRGVKDPVLPGGAPPSVVLPPAPTTFIGRDIELKSLTKALATGGGAALVGTGGIGKTTLAQEYVRLAQKRVDGSPPKYSWIWWLDASTEGALAGSLAEEGRGALSASGAAGVSLVTDADAEAHARRLLRNHSRWLVVLDGAASVTVVHNAMTGASAGTFLVTTRERLNWQDIGVAPTDVPPLSVGDAVDLLIARARPPSLDGWETTGPAGDLVAELGCLPLAVAQVGALLHLDGERDPSTMLARWRKNPAPFLDATPGTSSERTMAHIWDLSIARLEQHDPSAVQLLSILGWLGPPEGIPKALLNSLPVGMFSDGPGTPLRAAASASLLTMRADLITVHPVLHRVLRIADETVPQRRGHRVDEARATAAKMLRQALGDADPSDPVTWPTIRPLVESVGLLITHGTSGQDEDASYVVRKVGEFLSEQGSYQRAVALFEWNLERAQEATKPNLPDILTARHDLAETLVDRRGRGDLDRAIDLLESVFGDRERILSTNAPETLAARQHLARALAKRGGQSDQDRAIDLFRGVVASRSRTLPANDSDALTARHDLAWALVKRHEQRDRDEAVELSQMVLAACERTLGTDHPRTLSFRHTYAWALREHREPGDLDESVRLYQSVLNDKERILGTDHPRTLATRHNLGQALVDRRGEGDLQKAIDLYEGVFAGRRRILTTYHPRTLATRHDLAWALKERGKPGDLATAIDLFQSVLTDRERVLGPDHADTLTTRHDLAWALKERGKPGDLATAIDLFQSVLTDRERVLGPDHIDTLTTRNNLAWALKQRGGSGDLAHAITLYESVLTDRERILSRDHPSTLVTRNNLAWALEERRGPGDLAHAIALFESVLTDRERVLDPGHPHTLAARHNLAQALWQRGGRGDLETAIDLFRSVLTDRERILGRDHPSTLVTRNDLAWALEERREPGDLTNAIALFKSVLTDRERILGTDHPDTLTTRNNLAWALERRGGPEDLATAIDLFESVLTDRELVLDPDHPHTLTARHNVAQALGHRGGRGDRDAAIALYRLVLADRERVLGPDHPDTRTTRNNLAEALKKPH